MLGTAAFDHSLRTSPRGDEDGIIRFLVCMYKLAKYLTYPYTWMLVVAILLMVAIFGRLSTRRLVIVRFLAISLLLMLYGFATPLVAHVLIASLEEQYPPFDASLRRDFGSIVILGGAIMEKGSLRPFNELAASSAERTVCGADLYARGYAGTVILSGGDASSLKGRR